METLDKPVPFPFATSLIHKGGGRYKADTTTPLRVAIHDGIGEVLVYLCQIGVNITFSTLITATLGGTVSERHLVALFEAYFRQNKDLRNSDITLVGEGVSSGSTAGPHSSSTGLPASSASSPDTLTSGVGIDLRRGLAGRLVNEETSRQRALLNAPLPARFISMASDGSGGAAALKGRTRVQEDGTTVLPGDASPFMRS